MFENNYHVYIMASYKRTLYVGVTNDLVRRVAEHQDKIIEGFTKKYNCTRLVYFENFNDINEAIEREKQLKKWRREKKIRLIEEMNPDWDDLSQSI
ncbi:MAG TPA: GIY-YIG nuclease family protein [Candidatus Bipolaricaulota bacterium]|nr:GIY-YIG nuclease family protein [Candidatus Bipolaricaulota bacterium]